MERVRFAPSPTGPLHIGGVRTALFNFLYARKENGVFIVRVEDTDQNRYVEGAEEYIFNALEWLGLIVDESPVHGGEYGPYRQSERKDVYKKYIDLLIEKGGAYYAFDSEDELEALRLASEKNGETFKYGRHNRGRLKNSLSLSLDQTRSKLEREPYVVRLKNIETDSIIATDLLRGNVKVSSDEIDDKILLKADGMPTYHFANVVDDYLMKITTVIRGEEWLPSLALHNLIYKYFDWETPKFIHLPLILKPEGKGKLSKRDGEKGGFPVFPLTWRESIGFKDMGYIKEGMINYLSLLGWNSGAENEIFSLADLKRLFDIKGLHKGGARFDIKKALWTNNQHLQRLSNTDIIQRMGLKNEQNMISKIDLIKERANTLNDLSNMLSWFTVNPSDYDIKILSKINTDDCRRLLTLTVENYNENEQLTKEAYLALLSQLEVKVGLGMQCLRVALFGELIGPDLFAFITLLEKDVVLERLHNLLNNLN